MWYTFEQDLDWTEAVASDKKEVGCSIELRDPNNQVHPQPQNSTAPGRMGGAGGVW